MELTGPVFLVLVILATVAAFVALVVFWPRLAGRDLAHIAARVGLLLGVNLLVLFTAATQLNAQFLFFAGWSDLRGALGGKVATTSVARGGQASTAAAQKVEGPAATSHGLPPPLRAGAAVNGLLTYTVKGPLSGITASVVVQLPPGYASPA
jgi:hypothetical protein